MLSGHWGGLRTFCLAVTRFRYLGDPLFILACLAYLANRFWLKYALPWPPLHCWFNDFWLIPAALPPVLWVQRKLHWRTHDTPPTIGEIASHFVLWAIICEGIGPSLLSGHTKDWLDVVAYFLGALMAGLWWQRGQFFLCEPNCRHPSRLLDGSRRCDGTNSCQ